MARIVYLVCSVMAAFKAINHFENGAWLYVYTFGLMSVLCFWAMVKGLSLDDF